MQITTTSGNSFPEKLTELEWSKNKKCFLRKAYHNPFYDIKLHLLLDAAIEILAK